jgi:hypothetical protein
MSGIMGNCPYCKIPMKREVGNIPRVRIPLMGTTDDYLPRMFVPYSSYTTYLCEKCGKLELFMNKPVPWNAPKNSRTTRVSKV